ncbi:MAG: hypothetical protein Q9164_007293, partial [Protoblastenia rupestris]
MPGYLSTQPLHGVFPTTMQLETFLSPVTALTFLQLDRLCLLVGEGQHLKIFDREIGELLLVQAIFASQAVHGIVNGQSGNPTRSAATVLVWGGRSVRVLRISTGDISGHDGLVRVKSVTNEIQANDWFLDAHFRPSPFLEDECSVPEEAVLVTARNDLYILNLSKDTSYGDRQGQYLQHLQSGPNSILYSAHLTWNGDGRVLVASGTVTGEILVWSVLCVSGLQGSTPCQVHCNLQGHEGSVFGVRISEQARWSGSYTSRMLTSCSDDRTIRLWDISDVDQPESLRYSGACLAKVMGHASRIWSVRFLASDPSNLCILSFGEDGTAQVWRVEMFRQNGAAVKSNDELLPQMAQETTFAFHSGKNLWAAAVSIEENGSLLVATGGADGRVVSYSICTIKSPSSDRDLLACTMAEVSEICDDTADDNFARNLKARSIIREIFDSMVGQWNLVRTIKSMIPTQPSGCLQGMATVESRQVTKDVYDAESIYSEHGDFTSDLGFTMKATR